MKRRVLFLIVFILILSFCFCNISISAEEGQNEISTDNTSSENILDNSSKDVVPNIPADTSSEDNAEQSTPAKKTYTISYGKGLYLSYNGVEPNNFIKGTPPATQTVTEGGSVVVSENTFTFRDYTFGGWKYTYTNSAGEKKNKYYSTGDVLENVSSNMRLEATWVKKDVDLKIDAFTVYANTNEKSNHYIGEITVLKSAPTPPDPSYKFCGWTDNDGTVLYSAGDTYEIKHINTVIKPVWSKNGEQINYKKLSVKTNGKGTASISEIYLLSGTTKDISFTPNDGYKLSSLKINGEKVSAQNNITIKIETQDILVEAEFISIDSTIVAPEGKESFTITVVITGGEGNAAPKEITVMKGETATVKFTPSEGYNLPSSILDNGTEITSDENGSLGSEWNGEYTIKDVTENHTLEIEFISQNPHTNESKVEKTSKDTSEQNNGLSFTVKIIFVIIAIGAFFSIIAVKLVGSSKKKKNRRKKRKER